jgi:hypothetical protein
MTAIVKDIHTQMALCNFEKVIKDSINPMYKRSDGKPNYATLSAVHDAVKPELLAHGLYYHSFESLENHGFLCVRITHAESKTFIETFVRLLNMSDMQKYVASKTYARKSGISDLCSLYAEDDDGNLASTAQKPNTNAVTAAFKPIEPPVQLQAIKSDLKADLIGLWDMKKEAALKAFPAKAKSVDEIFTNRFTKANDDGELVDLETSELLRIKTWLKGM